MHKRLRFDLFAQRFPRDITEDHELADEESATRPPLNYGEAAIVLPDTGGNEDQVSRFFKTMYDGLPKDQWARMPYENLETRFPLTFHPFDDTLNKDNDLMMAIITPRAIPVNIFGSEKNTNPTYEFYNPSALACQLAFGQLPMRLCYADAMKPRETITSGLEWIRIAQCGGINPYTLTARLGPGGLAHHETVRGLIQLLGVSRKETKCKDQARF